MPIPMFTVRDDCRPYDQLHLLDAWEAWGIPLDEQWIWFTRLFGHDCPSDDLAYCLFLKEVDKAKAHLRQNIS